MRDVFRGWRRKVGFFALVLACVFAMGWLRSRTTSDFVRFFPVDSGGLAVLSESQSVSLQLWTGRRPESRKQKIEFFGVHLNEEQSPRFQHGQSLAVMDPEESYIFQNSRSWSAGYSLFVFPLMLSAGLLLLSKLHRRS